MKTFPTFLCLIISSGLANATIQNKADPDKPATIEITSGKVVKTGKWLGDVQLTWKYNSYWSKGSGGSIEYRNGECGPKGNAEVHGDKYTITGDGIAIDGNFFWEGHDCWDPGNDASGGNPLPPERLGWQISLPMLKGGLVDGSDIDYGCEWPPDWTAIFYENDSADCTVILHTGGKSSVQRQNLFVISGSASEITYPVGYSFGGDIMDGIGFWSEGDFTVGSNVPPTSIQVPGVGKSLGSDGNLYCALPDNADIDVTLQAPVAYYNFNVSAQKYKLHILANGNPLSEDRVRRGAYFCVGQLVNFQAVFSPNSIPSLNYTSPIWNYTADYVNNHYTSSTGCEIYNIAPIPAMSNPTPAWFYNKQTQDATANLGLYCKFNNGQSVYLVRQGKFNVFTPSITFTPAGSPTVNVRHYFAAVLFGIGQGDGTGALGMSANINSIPKFPGQAIATQLINRQASIDGIPFGTGGTTELDNTEIYSQASLTNDLNNPHSNLLGTVSVIDQPGIPITVASWASGNDQFNTYFRFRPDGDSDNIYVTLGRADWSWHGNVDYTGGVPYNSWLLSNWTISGAGTSGPTFHQVNDFPVWNGIYSNFP